MKMIEETDRLLLEEIRLLNAHTKKANRISAVALTLLGVFIVLFLVVIPFSQRISDHLKSTAHVSDSWYEVGILFDRGEDQKGQEMLERLVRKYPNYYWGYVRMGLVHQQVGNLEAAEKNYAKAAELFPNEVNEKTLVAIRKALQKNMRTPNQASDVPPRKLVEPQR
jgi:tetratricopeptide (TPR) repeat protein